MGAVKKYLHRSSLPSRELHHSRLFVDLAENIHIHHREYRTVFSLSEYFEYADIVSKSTNDVRSFLAQNSDYKESTYPTTIMIAGGKERQLEFLKNSPEPNASKYYDDIFAIELQEEYVTDEVHIHYRDFRIGVDRERFRRMANGFNEALIELDTFEKEHSYIRKSHPDRIIESYNDGKDEDSCIQTKQMGVVNIDLSKISSYWYNDISEWKHSSKAINLLREFISEGNEVCPIVISTEKNGNYFIVDGHHRFLAYYKEGLKSIPCVVLDIPFAATEELRKAEVLLKEFDTKTNYNYNVSGFYKSYIGFSTNRFYSNTFINKLKGQSFFRRVVRKILNVLGLREYVFKKFNESHNHHN